MAEQMGDCACVCVPAYAFSDKSVFSVSYFSTRSAFSLKKDIVDVRDLSEQ